MAQVTVTPESLRKTASDLSSISGEMKVITDTMASIIEEIKKAWPDDNGTQFAGRFETEVQSQFAKYYNTVQEYSDFIQRASDKYQATHAAVNSTITKGA